MDDEYWRWPPTSNVLHVCRYARRLRADLEDNLHIGPGKLDATNAEQVPKSGTL